MFGLIFVDINSPIHRQYSHQGVIGNIKGFISMLNDSIRRRPKVSRWCAISVTLCLHRSVSLSDGSGEGPDKVLTTSPAPVYREFPGPKSFSIIRGRLYIVYVSVQPVHARSVAAGTSSCRTRAYARVHKLNKSHLSLTYSYTFRNSTILR